MTAPPTGIQTEDEEETAASWIHYNEMHKILGSCHIIKPLMLIDSSNSNLITVNKAKPIVQNNTLSKQKQEKLIMDNSSVDTLSFKVPGVNKLLKVLSTINVFHLSSLDSISSSVLIENQPPQQEQTKKISNQTSKNKRKLLKVHFFHHSFFFFTGKYVIFIEGDLNFFIVINILE